MDKHEPLDVILDKLFAVILERKSASPAGSYVASLYAKGLDHILKKVGEECTELIVAAKNREPQAILHETADLWFHSLVMLADQNLSPDLVLQELIRRFSHSGRVVLDLDRRRNPRISHRRSLTLELFNGLVIQGETQDVSLNGLFLYTDHEPKWKLLGELGNFTMTVQNKNIQFMAEVTRVTDAGLGLNIVRDNGLFGCVLSEVENLF